MTHPLINLALGLTVLATPCVALAQSNEIDPDGTYRFHMVQEGRVMTADDFQAWMNQRGMSVSQSGHTARPASIVGQGLSGQRMTGQGMSGQSLAIQSPAMISGSRSHQVQYQQTAQNWEPAKTPIYNQPSRPQTDGNGHLTGYDSNWDGTGGGSYNSGYSSGSAGGGYSSGPVHSYDSGRDY